MHHAHNTLYENLNLSREVYSSEFTSYEILDPYLDSYKLINS